MPPIVSFSQVKSVGAEISLFYEQREHLLLLKRLRIAQVQPSRDSLGAVRDRGLGRWFILHNLTTSTALPSICLIEVSREPKSQKGLDESQRCAMDLASRYLRPTRAMHQEPGVQLSRYQRLLHT